MKITQTPQHPVPPVRDAAEPKGPDRIDDHDGDDASAPSPTPPRGQGAVIDTKA